MAGPICHVVAVASLEDGGGENLESIMGREEKNKKEEEENKSSVEEATF